MKKPEGYDEAVVGTGYTSLEVGGHHLFVRQVEETTSNSGKPMIKIYFDTDARDKQPAYYASDYRSRLEQYPDAKWQGVSYIVLPIDGQEDTDPYKWSLRSLKAFITAVEHSNDGFKFAWNGWQAFADKRVGGTFREEEYLNTNGDIRTSVKLAWFCSTKEVDNQPIPKVKKLPNNPAPAKHKDDTKLPFEL